MSIPAAKGRLKWLGRSDTIKHLDDERERMILKFKRSDQPTIGVEVEMQLVDRKTGRLVSRISEILSRIPETMRERIKPEFFQCTVEVNTDICRSVDEVGRELTERFDYVNHLADSLGMGLICAGTHPISSWREQKITEDPRYQRLLQEFQLLGRRLNIYGFHVHIGVTDGDKATAILNILRGYLPHLLALSTSSPFWSGYDTGMYSSRIKVFEVLPTAGLPPRVENWAAFEKLVKILIATRTIESTREIWWEARPHPRFGTVEIRVCDCPSTLEDMLIITALVQALVVHLSSRYEKDTLPEIPLRQLVEENKWQAARHGLDGYFIDYQTNHTVGIREALRDLADRLQDTARSLGTGPYLNQVQTILQRGTSAHRQRDIHRRSGNLNDVVHDLMESLKA